MKFYMPTTLEELAAKFIENDLEPQIDPMDRKQVEKGAGQIAAFVRGLIQHDRESTVRVVDACRPEFDNEPFAFMTSLGVAMDGVAAVGPDVVEREIVVRGFLSNSDVAEYSWDDDGLRYVKHRPGRSPEEIRAAQADKPAVEAARRSQDEQRTAAEKARVATDLAPYIKKVEAVVAANPGGCTKKSDLAAAAGGKREHTLRAIDVLLEKGAIVERDGFRPGGVQ